MIKYNPDENKIKGFMNPKELVELYYTALKNPPFDDAPMRVLEIGSWKGRSAHALCSAMIDKLRPEALAMSEIVFVDNWSKEKDLMVEEGSAFKAFKENILDNVKFEGIRKNLIMGTSDDLFKAYKNKPPFDLVFIDADHNYDPFVKDVHNSWDLLRERGFMIGHDFRPKLSGRVADAVNDLFGKGYYETMAGSLWGVRKTSSIIGGTDVFRKS
jgi:predicted O-methyltransferase YrrM